MLCTLLVHCCYMLVHFCYNLVLNVLLVESDVTFEGGHGGVAQAHCPNREYAMYNIYIYIYTRQIHAGVVWSGMVCIWPPLHVMNQVIEWPANWLCCDSVIVWLLRDLDK